MSSDALAGIGGSLFPGRYLAHAICTRPRLAEDAAIIESKRRQLERWWTHVSTTCGPATGQRAIFDLIAMPLFGALGFRARGATFDRMFASVRLETPAQTPVALVMLPWAARRSARWRDAVGSARGMDANWCFVFAPPFLSLVDARGHASRQSLDVVLPDVLDRRSFPRLWDIAHARAFDPAHHPIIDRLLADAAQFQDGVRADLQEGVVEALAALSECLHATRRHILAGDDHEALTIVYRVLFLLFAESRDLVPRSHPVYSGAYAVSTLCRDALRHHDAVGLWSALAAVSRLSRAGCRVDDLIVRPFNGRLFARAAAPSLELADRAKRPERRPNSRDAAMRRALVALGTRAGAGGREEISYADLDVEQLGAVYERVLDLDPGETRGRHSERRKESGTFYTPRSLAEFVVRRTLAPLVDGRSSDAILELRILDPAMGSGAFLVAACRYLAVVYERALIDEGRYSEADLDDHAHADVRRLIAEQCLAGVDLNPVAVQLARLSIWLTTLAAGKPLGFLDHRLRTGNSLIGASPDDLGRTGGRRRSAAADLPLFDAVGLEDAMRLATQPLAAIAARRDDEVADVRAKDALWKQFVAEQSPLARWRLAADLWCARWFWPPTTGKASSGGAAPSAPELRASLDAVLKGDRTLPSTDLARWLSLAQSSSVDNRFFHWPLEFADVFYDNLGRPKARAGFDAVIGNPPWEMLRHRNADLVSFIRESGLFPSCGQGHVNLYQPFLDRALSLTRPGGRVGLILPWGVAADDGASALRARLLDHTSLDTIVGIENSGGIFPIHRGLRFAVVVASPGRRTQEIRARFGVRSPAEIDELPGRAQAHTASSFPVRFTPALLRSIGGAAIRVPDVRGAHQLELLERLSREFPALGSAAGWNVTFGRELNASDNSASFGSEGLPILEGKHITPFATHLSSTRRRIRRREAERLLPDRRFDFPRLAYRDVSGVGNRYTLIAAVLPPGVVTTHTIFCLRTRLDDDAQQFLCGLFNSHVLNAVVRMLMGGHVTTGLVESLPVPLWTNDAAQRRLVRLARRAARQPWQPRLQAILQAHVARLYRLQAPAFDQLLDDVTHLSPAEREWTRRAFNN